MIKLFFPFAKPYLHLFATSLILTVFVVSFDALSLWFSSSLINSIFNSEIPQIDPVPFSLSTINAFLKYHSWQFLRAGGDGTMLAVLRKIALLIPLIFLLKNLALFTQKSFVALFNLKVIQGMREDFYQRSLHLPLSYFDTHRSGEITSYIVQDLNAINATMTAAINQLTVEPIKVVVFIALLLSIDVKLTLIILSIYPLLGFVIGRAGKVIRRRAKRSLNSFSRMVATITETINGIRVVKMFNGLTYETTKFENENDTYTRHSFRSTLVSNALSPFSEVINLTMTAIILWYAGSKILDGSSAFDSDDFIRFLIILFSLYSPVKKLIRITATLQGGKAAAERVSELLNQDLEKELHSNAIEKKSLRHGLEVKNLTFNYPNCDPVVLHNISFEVPQGAVVALVGSSGSGKSTILDLLPRFYEITKGDILLDGTNANTMDLHTLRSYFGIVSQDTVLFNDSILVNIAYGDPNPQMERILASLDAANAMEFVDQMELGVHTIVGERGVMLSGGQKQRLAIARALYKNPAVLILDEATSALDTESEKSVQDAIDTLIKDRTTIVVAHRLSTIKSADSILVLEKGAIVERGTHDELLRENGRYKELYEIQFGIEAK